MDQETNVVAKSQDLELPAPHSVMKTGLRECGSMEDPDGTLANVARSIELLRCSSTVQEKENCLKQLLDLINTCDSTIRVVGSHSQAVPILVSLLRSGPLGLKMQAATLLASLCKENELRVKVLLGGCIPPLLDLLKSSSTQGQIAAANTIYAVSQGGSNDHVRSKIFSTEGVVFVLWQQLEHGLRVENLVVNLLTRTLRNLSSTTEGFWFATTEAGGVNILLKLLASGESNTKENVCFLLACLMMEDSSICPKVLAADATKQLLKLLSPGNEASVRAEAACALKSLSVQSKEARQVIANYNGIPELINATIAPSKEFMQGEHAQALQDNAMCALSNISGGLSYVISSLGESLQSCTSPAQVADTLGALASALIIYDSRAEAIRELNPLIIEQMLIEQFKPHDLPCLVHQRTTESLASLYGNTLLSKKVTYSDAKHLLIGLITMITHEVHEEMIRSFLILCNSKGDLWYALQGRKGVQLLISLLGLSSEQQQEYVVALLCLLCNENDDSKWAITAAGGIPPLVQILETGSGKAKEYSASILGNLCNHSEDIRACVESADALPALLSLLKNGSQNGKEIAAKTLNHLIHISDTATISQLTSLLTSDLPESKIYVLDALKSLLSIFSIDDILHEGSAANDAIETMIKVLCSAKEETQTQVASVLAEVFACRKDLRESSIAVKALCSAKKLLDVDSERILVASLFCLSSIFLSIKENRDITTVSRDAFPRLAVLINSSVIEVAEQATSALANLLLDTEFTMQAFPEEIILSATRVLHDGTLDGRTHAAAAIAHLLHCCPADYALNNSVYCAQTVLELVSLLESASIEATATSEALDALSLLSSLEGASEDVKPACVVLAEHPHTVLPLVSCLASRTPLLQDKGIEILSKLCQYQPVVLGNSIASISGCISSLMGRVISSDSLKVKVGGTALLICAMNEHQQKVINSLNDSNSSLNLIRSLVNMVNMSHSRGDHDIKDICIYRNPEGKKRYDRAECSASMIVGESVSIWLLSLLACCDGKSKSAVVEIGAVEVLTDKISKYLSQAAKADFDEGGSTWVCALLLAVLFQDRDIIRSRATMQSIPVLADLLKSRESAHRYFAAQALASLACNGSRGTLLAVANSEVAIVLISMLGCSETDISDLLELSKEFSLVCNPELVTLERLFNVDDIRVGATSRKAIPALVDLLKPIPDRPGAPSLALGLLTQLAKDSSSNKLMMVEAGSLEALTKYLSLGPQDAMEEAAANLLGILFTSAEIQLHESAYGAINQLVVVLRLGGRNSRYSAAKALECLFSVDHIRNEEIAWQAIQPLLEVLNTGLEREQHAAIAALVRVLHGNPSAVLAVADAEMNVVDFLHDILSSNCSMELKGDAAELCCILFENIKIRFSMATAKCVKPLVSLLLVGFSPAQYSVVCALHKLLDDEQLAELVAAHGAVIPLAGLLVGRNYALHESVSRALVKLGKGRPACKMDMLKAGTIERILDILHAAPYFLCAAFAELLMILTNNTTLAKSSSAAKLVDPLFFLLARPDFGYNEQHDVLQVLINILEHPQCRADHSLTPHQAIEPLICLLGSRNQAVQQLAAELLSHLLMEEHLQKDVTTQKAIRPLIQILQSGISILQQGAIKVLVSTALTWPNLIVKEDGVRELSKVILQSDSSLPHALWEAAACILSSILQFSSEYYLEVPIAVLVRMLHSGMESTVVGALNALLVLESDDATIAEAMVDCGAIEALLELLTSHRCEESTARLLEALLNNVKVREKKAAECAILPISQYLLDPQTQAQEARLLTTLALGDLFQNEALTRSTDAALACRALVNLLKDQLKEETKAVVICVLQNLVMYSWSNKKAVAEAGGVQVVIDFVSSDDPDTSVQAAILVKLIFSNHTIQEYASSETVTVITAAIKKNLWASGTVNEEYLRALNALFSSFPSLTVTEPATLSIPHLVMSLKASTEATQEAALDSLYLLRHSWSACPVEVYRVQSVAAAEAIPLLQHIIQSGPSRFQEKAEQILHCLPGTLVVIIKRGNNLKQSVGNPNAYCKLTLGNYPSRQTKVLSTGSTPEWNESFAWSFDSPPKGQKLLISCKNKNKIGKGSFGKVTIQINQVVMLGAVSGEYPLLPVSKNGPPKNLEIEFHWSNK